MSRISRDSGGVEEALVCSLRLGCSVLLLAVFRLQVKAAMKGNAVLDARNSLRAHPLPKNFVVQRIGAGE